MIPAKFDYVRAKSVAQARELLREHGEDAKLLAGGHSLIPMMKLRLAQPRVLVDIAGIPGMDSIEVAAGAVTIGALVRHAALAASEPLRRSAPALWDAANELGDAQVRNRGTIGGACAHADPAADYPAVMLALDAVLTLEGERRRSIRAADFFQGMFETALATDDVLSAVAFALAPHSAYVKLHHPASHYAVAGVAAKLELAGGTIASARIALTGVGFAAFRAPAVEAALAGIAVLDTAAIRAACTGAAAGADIRSDAYASAAYRTAMADVFAARAVERAAAR
ncbi:MAG TPA: xanthine dehydrogenase family protein subunit M [Candidatus Acidoferrales bacterium]|nr:xanthine dehydrogenase family protein subunit M [Candidatus Acidoferrales bacterium]